MRTDILNCLHPSYVQHPQILQEDYIDQDPGIQLEKVHNLAKYVFPKQYGLLNVFERSTINKNGKDKPDFEDRESKIKVRLFLY